MSTHRYTDELTHVVDSIRECCSQKGLKVFPGLVNGEKAHKVYWRTPRSDDWRAFLDIAATLSVQIVYLDVSRFEQADIEDAKNGLLPGAEHELALTQFASRIGETSWFELGFFLGPVYHTYSRTTEWYDSFSELTEQPEPSLIADDVEAGPDLINRWAETLAKHERFSSCRNWSQRMFLLMEIAGDEFDQLRHGQGIKKTIKKAEQYYFINIQPRLDEKLKAEARALREQGISLTEIARRLGVSRDKIRGLKLRVLSDSCDEI